MITTVIGRVLFERRMDSTIRNRWFAARICLVIFAALLSFAPSARAQKVTAAFNLDPSFPGLEVDAIAVNTETNKIYIATQATAGPGNSGRIFVLDGATNQVLTSISDTSSNAFQPFAIAINPVTNIIYVANTGGGSSFGSVTVIDGATDTYVATMNDGNSDKPQAIVVNPETNIVYVANNVSGNVTHYSGSTRNLNGTINVGSSLGTIGVGTGPAALAFNPGANLLYVVNSGVVNGSQINHGGISVVNTTSNGVSTVTDTSGALDPVAVAVDVSSGLAYVAENTPPSLTVISGSTYSTTIHDPGGATTPRSVAVNPLTHRVYLADIGGGPGTVSIFQGTAYQATVAMGTGPNVVAVDTATDIAYAPNDDGNISVISGATGMQITTASTSAGLEVISVNPVTHKAYVAIDNLGGEAAIAVIDGATNTTPPDAISAPSQPFAVAVNPVTNTIYVANNNSNDVSVIDGVTDTLIGDPVGAGTSPDAIVVDPMNNLIYVANLNGNSVTVIDGSTNDGTHTINFNTPLTPDSLAFNPIRNTVYGASSAASLGFSFPSFFGDQGAFAGGYAFGGMHGIAVAADPASGMSHTLLLTGDFGVPFLTVDDGAAPFGFYLDACFTPSTSAPIAMDINTANHTVFVVCSDGYINVFQGASGFTSGNFTNIPPPDAYAGPYTAVAVNPYTNLAYITDSGSSNLIVIDGATNSFKTAVSVAANPVSVAVNIAMNKIYVLSAGTPPSAPVSVPPTITIVDGVTNSMLGSIQTGTTGQVDNHNHEIAVNPASGKIYALARGGNNVRVVRENIPAANCDPASCLQTTIVPLVNNTTFTSVPTFSFTATNHFSSAPVTGVYFQVDTMQGKWTPAPASGGGFSGTAPSITPGFHMLYAYATAGDDANTSSFNGLQASPVTGAIASYGFLSAPPIANAQPSLFFGNVAQGGSFTQGAYLANEGGAPLNYSYIPQRSGCRGLRHQYWCFSSLR